MKEAILITQAISFAMVAFCIFGFILVFRKDKTRGFEIALWIILLLDLGLFLAERLLVKVGGVNIPLSIELITNWSVAIKFHMALTALIFFLFFYAGERRNNHG
jgi:hypothetical protein